MPRLRTIVLIALIALGWTFSPFLELLSERPTQSDFDGIAKFGLFTSDDGVELLASIDAEDGARIFDIHAKITDKTIPLSWRLSPPRAATFEVKNRSGAIVGSMEAPDNHTLILKPASDASTVVFRRDENPPYRQHLIEFENDGVKLAATIFEPISTHATTGVVMIHGSGKSDRNNLWYVAQADHLARQGITVLLPDKRGSGRSGGLWKTATMIDLAADANAAFTAFANMEELSLSRIGLMGLSQGGHIAPVAASENENVAFVINVVGSLTTFDEALTHESSNLFRGHGPGLLSAPLIFIANQVARARIPIWWYRNGSFSSLPYWSELKVPGLIIWGEEDEFDNVSVARSTALLEEINKARSNPIDLKIYPGLGHALFDETGWFSEEYLSHLTIWIHQAGGDPATQQVEKIDTSG